MSSSFERVLLDLVEGLEESGIEYALVGGVAVLAWGDPRTTRDIDVIAQLDASDLGDVAERLEPHGFRFDRPGALRALDEGSHFTIFHDDAFYHVDMVPASTASHERTLEGRRRVEIEDRVAWVASPEDTIANKLVFGAEQDLKDAAGILARLGEDIDDERLEVLCSKLGVREDLGRLRERVDEALE